MTASLSRMSPSMTLTWRPVRFFLGLLGLTRARSTKPSRKSSLATAEPTKPLAPVINATSFPTWSLPLLPRMIAQPELIRLNPDRHIPKKDSSFVLCIEGILQTFLTEAIQSRVTSMPVIIAPPLLFATGDFTGGMTRCTCRQAEHEIASGLPDFSLEGANHEGS